MAGWPSTQCAAVITILDATTAAPQNCAANGSAMPAERIAATNGYEPCFASEALTTRDSARAAGDTATAASITDRTAARVARTGREHRLGKAHAPPIAALPQHRGCPDASRTDRIRPVGTPRIRRIPGMRHG